jgi:hypothetical protein
MQDLLQHIDHDYYRSAQLVIARAEIAQLRRQSSVLARSEQQCKIPAGAFCPVDDFDQTSPAALLVQSGAPELQVPPDLNH